ncbi:MAG: glycosyltransferase family 4 protein [Usitatibacter sp.]
MKVALVSVGTGQTRRGYERFMTDLFAVLRADVDVTLFKGAGEPAPGECVVRHMKRTGTVARMAGDRMGYTRSRIEFATFAVALWPRLMGGRFDVVHVVDPPLAPKLARMRSLTRAKYGFVFTDGGPAVFDATPYADVVLYISPEQQREAIARGAAPAKGLMLPMGVDTSWMGEAVDRAALRREHGVAADTFVILAVAALNRHHKRVDYLIDEIAKVPGDIVLWIDGGVQPDGDASLLQLARDRLGGRFRHTHVPSGRVRDLYRLADVTVSAAFHESQGLALIEAMCAGLPVVAHDSPHFRWLLDGHGHLVDMAVPGALADRLVHLLGHREELRKPGDRDSARRRFGWESLKETYLDVYRRVVAEAA